MEKAGTVTETAERVAAAVDGNRLWNRLTSLAQVGRTEEGGVCRLALSAEDMAARSQLVDWGRELGYRVSVDPVGNLFIRRPGLDDRADPVMTGSHLDTQLIGGAFDGSVGVLGGLEAMQALDDAGVATRRPIELVCWTNELGSRFRPAGMGSLVHAGLFALDRALAVQDEDGVSVREALGALFADEPDLPQRPLHTPAAAFVEMHIEQGPLLEASGCPLGIVTAIQGYRWFTVEVRGDDAHAGTTPRTARRDALIAAVDMIRALDSLMAEDEASRFTVGRLEIAPNISNAVPSRATFSVDLRHPDAAALARLGNAVTRVCTEQAGPCDVTVRELMHKDPEGFSPLITGALEAAADRLGERWTRTTSGAGHDARHLAHVCPSAMLFVPSRGGISNHPSEFTGQTHLTIGTRVLAGTLATLADTL